MKSYLILALVIVGLFTQTPQQIPGRVECELYNAGGEGSAYHDSDEINNGSGKLNPANGSYLNEFRMREGVDISYTKEKNIDNTIYNKVQPEMNSLYVGWTVPGEWINYDVAVERGGTYKVALMYTANGNGAVALEIDGKEELSSDVISTSDPADTVSWRQWHHWNKLDIGKIKLTKGKHVLTLKTVKNGNMNYDYLEFRPQ